MPISVDLPAPFSPSRQCTSPDQSFRSTASFASTPGNAFVIPVSSTIGVSFRLFTLGDSVCWKSVRPRRPEGSAGGHCAWPYLISFWTALALCATGMVIFPALIFACAAWIWAQVAAGMYFECSSEMPPFLRLRL